MRNRDLWTMAAAGVLALSGCSTLTAGGDGPAYVRDSMRDHRFPRACEELWVQALQVLSSQGFGLVGSDRELAGQEKQGFIGSFLNRGHATWRNDDGVFEAETDSNRQGLRFVIRGTPAGKDGCFVTYTAVQEDKANLTEERHRDYDQELLLLSRVDPAAAAKIYEGIDKLK